MGFDTKKYLDYAGLSQFWNSIKDFYSSSVDKSIVDKALKDSNGDIIHSTYLKSADAVTTYMPIGATVAGLNVKDDPSAEALRQKLNVADGAQVNVIEHVAVKHRDETVFTDLTIDENKRVNLDLNRYALKSDLTHVFVFKGTVATVADLPNTSEVKVGWIYHVEEKSSEYVCTAEKTASTDVVWEEMGSIIDLSAYRKSADQDVIDNAIKARLDVIEGTGEGSVKKALSDAKAYTDTSINSLNKTVTQVAGTDGLAIEVTQENGLLKSVSGSIATNTYDAYGSASSAETHSKEYADAKLNALVLPTVGEDGKYIKLVGQVGGQISATTEGFVKKAEFDASESDVLAPTVLAVKSGDDAVYNSFASIEDYSIRKLFISNVKSAATSTDLKSAINNIGSNTGVVITLENSIAIDERLSVAEGKTVIIDLNGQTLTNTSSDRFINVAPGGYCAISNGVITGSNSTYNIVVRGNGNIGTSGSTLIMDGVTMSNSGDMNLLLASNGLDKDVNIVLKNCNFDGAMYLPARGSITIEGGSFTSTDAEVLYVKNGSPLSISNANFTTTLTSASDGNWAHYNDGYVSAPAALTVEACNYGSLGNPSVTINGGSFNVVKNGTSVSEVFGILVINYDGNVPTGGAITSNVEYFKTGNITGHVTSDGTTEPSDGWVVFSENATGDGKVTRV